MATTLKVYADEDDALLFWAVPAPIAGCRGFAIARRRTDPQGNTDVEFLPNRVGFADDPPPQPGDVAHTEPSTEWPFQRFSWTDHGANTGDTVSYQVIPMVRDDTGSLVQLSQQASEWSPGLRLGAASGSRFRAFFNRGFVISQFMSRYLAEKHLTLRQFKDNIQDQNEQDIREFLSGDLRLAMLDELRTAESDDTEIFAALFELNDDELVDKLCTLGERAHVVLANGSVPAKGESAADARQHDDENKDARAKLLAANVDVAAHDRFTSPGPLAHNKFLVRTDSSGVPVVAWTGSTNWTVTGLCTQLNNGLLVEDPAIAAVYLEQWHRLRDAKSSFPRSLVAANGTPTTPAAPSGDTAQATVWFSRTAGEVDLYALRQVVASARQGILFLMFMPGNNGVFPAVMARTGEPDLYVRGVVSDLPHGRGDESAVNVSLIDRTHQHQVSLNIIQPVQPDVIQPEGIAHPFANFAAEVTRQQFLANIGHAIIHSKVLVVDPFSDQPTVVTGSHNFSELASKSNDENFLIIKGDNALAEAYAVNIMAAYDHYRWRAHLSRETKPFNGLRDDDSWMAPKLADESKDLHFWGVG
ncbi:MAG: hypothetical protein JOZ23_17025 [Mycobacterium sp.]|nr:hypothetical protein [Mycobacterium sp.]